MMGAVLIGVTGLATIQAGSGPDYLNSNSRRQQRLEHTTTDGPGAVLFELPDGWEMPQNEPGGVVLIDPDRPGRQLSVVTLSVSEPAAPDQMIYRFVELHPDPSVRSTLRPATQPFLFSLVEAQLRGAQFIGTSGEEGDEVRQHLLACLTPDLTHYWMIYITDTVKRDSDMRASLRENTRLLQAVYRSARVETK